MYINNILPDGEDEDIDSRVLSYQPFDEFELIMGKQVEATQVIRLPYALGLTTSDYICLSDENYSYIMSLDRQQRLKIFNMILDWRCR